MVPRDEVRRVLVHEVLRTCTAEARLALCKALNTHFGPTGGELISVPYWERLADLLERRHREAR